MIARGLGLGVPAGAERVLPLCRRQLAEKVADPSHVGRRHACGDVRLAPTALVVERHAVAFDAVDEPLLFESLNVVASAGHQPPRLSERRAEILHDIEVARIVSVRLNAIDDVLRVFEVPVVDHHHQYEQTLEWARADEGVVVPGPLTDVLLGFRLQTEPPARLNSRAAVLVESPPRHVVAGRLVVPDGPQQPRDNDLGLRFGTELHAPRAPRWIADIITRAESRLVHFKKGVACRGIWKQ